MAKLTLKRKEVADKYECDLEKDMVVHMKAYSGAVSNINLAGAEQLAKSKIPYFYEKATADDKKTTKPPAQSSGG